METLHRLLSSTSVRRLVTFAIAAGLSALVGFTVDDSVVDGVITFVDVIITGYLVKAGDA